MAAQNPLVLTANCLRSGDVVYWQSGRWVESLAEAEIFSDKTAAEAGVAQAQAFVAANQIVTPYLFEVSQDNSGPHPVKEREIIRSRGPSVRPDTGKQTAHV
jgi:hypothetical protein